MSEGQGEQGSTRAAGPARDEVARRRELLRRLGAAAAVPAVVAAIMNPQRPAKAY